MVKTKDIKRVPKLRFPGFKGEWAASKLGDIAEKIQDGTHFSPKQYETGNFKYITSRNIRNGYMDLCNVPYLSDKAHRKIYKRCDVRYNDVLLTKDGAGTGNVCLNELEEEFSLLSSVAFIRANKNKAINEYLYQYICSPNGQREIRSTIAGQAITRITLTKLRNFKFHFPTILEQEKIASFLSAVDKKIQQLTAGKQLLEQYKKGVMQKFFSQEIRFTDDKGKDYPDWEDKELGNIAERITAKNKNSTVKFVLTNSATKGVVSQEDYFDRDIANKDNLQGYYVVEKGDFVYNPRISSSAPVGPIKRNKLQKGIMSPLYTVFRFKVENPEYFEYFFETTMWHKYMHSIANFGARHDRMNITNADFLKMLIPFPCNDERERISLFLRDLTKKLDSTKASLIQTHTFKKGLLQQLFV